MTDDELRQLADLNLLQFNCDVARWRVPHEIIEENGMVFIVHPSAFPPFNILFPWTSPQDRDSRAIIEKGIRFFSERHKGFSIMLRGHCDGDLVTTCRELELQDLGAGPCMVLEKPLPQRSPPSGLHLCWVTDLAGIGDFIQVVTDSYVSLGMPKEKNLELLSRPDRMQQPHYHWLVAYQHGRPVCSAMITLSHSIASVNYVGTVESARKRGLAELCTLVVVNRAFALGARAVILQASKMGHSIYIRMGFRQITHYRWFIFSDRK